MKRILFGVVLADRDNVISLVELVGFDAFKLQAQSGIQMLLVLPSIILVKLKEERHQMILVLGLLDINII